MKSYVILFRGINVGGKNLLPMKPLVSLLEQHGFAQVSHYIQSGNLVLQYPSDPKAAIEQLVLAHFDIQPEVLVLEQSAFLQAFENNPYPENEGKTVHFYFCSDAPCLDHQRIEQLIAESESFELVDNVFYLLAPDGIGRSKLVAKIESCLGCSATGRNLNTVNKIKAMLDKLV